ncbi:MAG: MFS transporter [Leucobacter sp.]
MAAVNPAPTPARWVTGVLIVFTAFGFGFGNWLSRLPAVRDHLGASTFDMSIIGLTMAAGAVLGLSLAGRTVTWLGPRKVIMFAAFGQAIFMPLGATLFWIDQAPAGMALIAAFGFCFSSGDVAMNVSGAAAERALGKPRMPILHGGYSLGSVFSMGTGAIAEVTNVPVPIHLGIVFLVIVVAVLFAARHIPRIETADLPTAPIPVSLSTGPIQVLTPTVAPSTERAQSRYNPWRDPRIIVIGLIAMSLSLSEGTATDWLPLALTDQRGFLNSTAALALGGFYVSMLVARASGSLLLLRFGRVTILRASAVISIVGIVLMYALPFTWAGFVCAVLWGLGSALGFPIAVSAAADDPKKAVRGVATVAMIAYGAFLVGPVAIGLVGEKLGLLTAFLPLTLLLVFVLFAAGTAREAGRR